LIGASPPTRLLAGIALVAAPLALAACQDQTAPQAAKPDRPVLVERVAFVPRHLERSFVATIRPRIESDLGFRVAGKVAQRLVGVGDRVKVGQPLATLDETDLRLQREQAEAELRAATAALANAEAELKRVQTLNTQGWSTTATLDRQRALTEDARSRLLRAERAVSLAENSFSYATLTADADGVVTATLVEPGQVVASGQGAIRLARLADPDAVIAVPETLVEAVRTGRASVSLWSHPDHRYRARLRELSPSADPTTRTYLARFTVEGAGTEMQLGMTATLKLSEGGDEQVARLPLSALANEGQGPSVFVVDADGRLVRRPVTVAGYEAREVLIASGLEPGDQVVTLGVQKLDPGQRVRVVQGLQF
jgi:RND family efflux transporter MFP subunit